MNNSPIRRLSTIIPGFCLCCACAELIPIDDLYIDEDGQKWDHCKPCSIKLKLDNS